MEKKILTYSFLATVLDSNRDLNSFKKIFYPLIKSTLSDFCKNKETMDNHIDSIKKLFDKKFDLDIPFPFLKELLTDVQKEMKETNSESDFILHKDRSFIIKNYAFNDFEEKCISIEEEIDELVSVYKKYLKIQEIEFTEDIDLIQYIKEVSIITPNNFHHNQDFSENDEKSCIQAIFLSSIRTEKKLFNIARKIFLGSVVSCYLDTNIGKIQQSLEFLLDTNFILGLLDLNSIESTHTCQKIIEIAKKLGIQLTVLPITINETTSLIEARARNLDKAYFQAHLDPEDIYSAASRRNLSSSDLARIVDNLMIKLSKMGINILSTDQVFQNKAKFNTNVYDFYKKARNTNFSALHDATCITYVREKRIRYLNGSILNAKCWFVTNTHRSLYYPAAKNSLPEIIRADTIIKYLWLSNPKEFNNKTLEFSNISFIKQISASIYASLPSTRVLKELDENINKFKKDEIRPEDILNLSERISRRALKNNDLKDLNQIYSDDPAKFVQRVHEISELQKKENERFYEAISVIKNNYDNSDKDKIETKNDFKFPFIVLLSLVIFYLVFSYATFFDTKYIFHGKITWSLSLVALTFSLIYKLYRKITIPVVVTILCATFTFM